MYRVLIVDDEIPVCVGLKKMINWEEFGFQVDAMASNGQEALSLHFANPFDLIITDLKMPVMDGLTLIKNVHDGPHPCEIMIISAFGEFELAQKAMQYGVKYYLVKPLDETIMEGFLSQITEKYELHEQPLTGTPNKDLIQRQYCISANGPITEVKRYINTHFGEQLSLNFLAYKYSFSPAYLGRLFKKEVGVSFNDYLRNTRIFASCDMMEDSSLSINEISKKCGYSDPYYFSKQFRQVMDVAPTDYRAIKEQES